VSFERFNQSYVVLKSLESHVVLKFPKIFQGC